MRARLVAVLMAVCPRVYPHGAAPAKPVRPYITYFKIDGEAVNYVDDAIPTEQNAAMQINVWADRQTDADVLIKQVDDAIRTAKTMQGRSMGAAIDTPYETDTRLSGCVQRFDIWASR